MTEGFIWRDAEVTYPDMRGTAQLDERQTASQIEAIVGLDPKDWHIIGLDLGGGEHGHDLRVVAVNSKDVVGTSDVWPTTAGANGGELPVTEFLVHGADPYAVLKAITHVFELRLRSRGTRDLPIRVVNQSDTQAVPGYSG